MFDNIVTGFHLNNCAYSFHVQTDAPTSALEILLDCLGWMPDKLIEAVLYQSHLYVAVHSERNDHEITLQGGAGGNVSLCMQQLYLL